MTAITAEQRARLRGWHRQWLQSNEPGSLLGDILASKVPGLIDAYDALERRLAATERVARTVSADWGMTDETIRELVDAELAKEAGDGA